MSFWTNSFIYKELTKKTSIFGLRRWVLISVVAGAAVVLFLFFCTCCFACCRRRRHRRHRRQKVLPKHQQQQFTPPPQWAQSPNWNPSPPAPPSKDVLEISPAHHHHQYQHEQKPAEVQIEIEKQEHGDRPRPHDEGPRSHAVASPEVSNLRWGHCYTMRELEEATGEFAEENVIGEGGYGIVYCGILADNTRIAIKDLLNNRGQADKEFKVEVESIGRVRHKHLVSLLGYCIEGEKRMLVYEYVDNGNVDQWLHGDVGEVSPLTWEIRMKILLGIAKGLAYLHEGLEPKVVHRDIKASNILLDRRWNPKISDFGLAKLLGPNKTHVTTRVMGTFGYVAPEYASTGKLNERSDVFSFGVLIMEMVSGRTPVDYRRPRDEVHLVEWLKTMVGERRAEEVVDPKLPEKPSSKALKRALLLALQCIDPDSKMRPRMSSVIPLLEMDDLQHRNEHRVGRKAPSVQREYGKSEDGSSHKHDGAPSSNR